MRLSLIKKFQPEDFTSIDKKFLVALNTAMESIFNILNAGVDDHNLASSKLEFSTNKAQVINASNPVKILWTKSQAPVGVWVSKVTEVDTPVDNVACSSTPGVNWYYDSSNKQIVINKVFGLTVDGSANATKRYKITLNTSV